MDRSKVKVTLKINLLLDIFGDFIVAFIKFGVKLDLIGAHVQK